MLASLRIRRCQKSFVQNAMMARPAGNCLIIMLVGVTYYGHNSNLRTYVMISCKVLEFCCWRCPGQSFFTSTIILRFSKILSHFGNGWSRRRVPGAGGGSSGGPGCRVLLQALLRVLRFYYTVCCVAVSRTAFPSSRPTRPSRSPPVAQCCHSGSCSIRDLGGFLGGAFFATLPPSIFLWLNSCDSIGLRCE